MSKELVVEIKRKMLADIFLEVEKFNTEFVLDSAFFGSSVLINKQSIYFNESCFENLDTTNVPVSDKPEFEYMIAVDQLAAVPSIILYFEILNSKKSFDFEPYRLLLVEALSNFLKDGLFQEITFKNNQAVSYFLTPYYIYTTNTLYFPFGKAEPSEIPSFLYRYTVEKIINEIDISLFFYMLENVEINIIEAIDSI